MKLNDWKADAMRFEDIDREAERQGKLARDEADDAIQYHAKTGCWPNGLSTRAWDVVVAKGK